MQVTARRMLSTIVDEGDIVSILSSTAWQALGFVAAATLSQKYFLNIFFGPPLKILVAFALIIFFIFLSIMNFQIFRFPPKKKFQF